MKEDWKKSPLFQGISEEKIEELRKGEKCREKDYPRGRFVFLEGDRPGRLFVLLEGRVVISQNTVSGKRIRIADIDKPGDLFGEVYLFMEKEAYDMDAQVVENAVLLELPLEVFRVKDELSAMLQYNLMSIFARKAYQMNRRIKVLGSSGIREKIVRYLFERQDPAGNIRGNLAREEMAEYMGVARPSLSRELGLMQKEGILEIRGREILVADQERFEGYL